MYPESRHILRRRFGIACMVLSLAAVAWIAGRVGLIGPARSTHSVAAPVVGEVLAGSVTPLATPESTPSPTPGEILTAASTYRAPAPTTQPMPTATPVPVPTYTPKPTIFPVPSPTPIIKPRGCPSCPRPLTSSAELSVRCPQFIACPL